MPCCAAGVLPETRYARRGDVHVAYQVVGEADVDLVLVSAWFSHVEARWELPTLAHFLRRLAGFSRLISFDKVGIGLSDPLPPDHLLPLEEWMDDVRTVMDEVGSERAAIMAALDAGPAAIFFAATRPARTSALVLVHTTAKYVATNDYPIGIAEELFQTLLAQVDQLWGSEAMAAMMVPSRADDARFRRWFAKLQRASASPRAVQPLLRAAFEVDVRPLLGLVQAPTLVLHRQDDQILPVEHGRYLAEHIPGARLVELPGADAALMWETPELALDLIEEFLTGVRRAAEPTRVLATVLFTDIVGSTQQATRLGDRRWHQLLNMHDELARQLVEEFHGQLVKTTGDGILATFDGPGRGIRCAAALRDELHGIGLQLRAGLHTGEVELRDGDVGGIAVHVAARVGALAGAGEVLVSSTVKDLVAGSGIRFEDRGRKQLKGVPDEWQLFAAAP
jgi:class 3 adenylate cyclase